MDGVTSFDEAVLQGMRKAGVPNRYLQVEPAAQASVQPTFITGPVGSGKTHTAAAILKAYLKAGTYGNAEFGFWATPEAWFVNGAGYLRQVQDDFKGGWKAEAMRHSPFLVIDDLGQEAPTTWAVAELFRLVDYRYGEELTTVITSQFTPDGLARRLRVEGGEQQALAIASRLFELCELRIIDHADRRLA